MKKNLILIAEDEPAYGKILKDMLVKRNCEVVVVLNGDELLKLARKITPDLVLLDLIMPIKNGFQVIEEMKKDQSLKNINVIALSNLGQTDDIEKAKKLGVNEYIVKSDEDLYSVIDKILRYLN